MWCFHVWTEKHETAKRLFQRIKTVLDVAKSKGFRLDENPVTAIREGKVPPTVKAKVLQFTILTARRPSEMLEMKWPKVDVGARLWPF